MELVCPTFSTRPIVDKVGVAPQHQICDQREDHAKLPRYEVPPARREGARPAGQALFQLKAEEGEAGDGVVVVAVYAFEA